MTTNHPSGQSLERRNGAPVGGAGAGGPIVLGLETSCDETAAALVRMQPDGAVDVLADVVWSQIEAHAPYRGVVPEIAARAHVEKADLAVAAALTESGLRPRDIGAVAATAGPGLIGGVMVGLTTGKAIALARGVPFIAVNHLEGHALSPLLGAGLTFPYLLFLASGGHCQFLAVGGLGDYRRLGSTIDDAAGEAFDKTARALGLGFPGGPLVEQAARGGDPRRFDLPRPLKGRPGCDLSFAGLKTAVARTAEALGALTDQDRADLAAGFQAAVGDVCADRARAAIQAYEALGYAGRSFVMAGGVAANQALRARLEAVCADAGYAFLAPPLRHCTDNAAMIALAGALRLEAGLISDFSAPAKARWPLDEASAAAAPTHMPGRKGAKA
jgi:N6-L-threonylcarbamoyladenine synthase